MDRSRRQFFSRLGRSLATGFAESGAPTGEEASAETAAEHARRWLRPPGALPEDAFRAACTRCTDCLKACPRNAIRRLGSEFGEDADTPAIIPDEAPCYLCKDLPCIAACESGALAPVEPHNVAMGVAVLDKGRCYLAAGQPCDYCIMRCPLKPKAIRLGDNGLPMISEENCAGCGVCSHLCPGGAISIRA
jgi:ferredoxin-type protein NapG